MDFNRVKELRNAMIEEASMHVRLRVYKLMEEVSWLKLEA